MEARVAKLEGDLANLAIDVAVIKSNYATKADLAEVKAELKAAIAETRSTIILWVVSSVFLAQLLPALLKKFGL